LPPRLASEIKREIARLSLIQEQIAALEGERDQAPTPCKDTEKKRVQLMCLTGIGPAIAAVMTRAWLWLKHQPKSAITRWFVQRTAGQSGRIRRIMIVAVARKLAIALWRFLEQGLVPQGAMLANR
jgi:transposase